MLFDIIVSCKEIKVSKIKTKTSKPRLVLLCGLPASGKTTLARQLATEIAAIRLCPDEWMLELGIDPFDDAMRDQLEKRFWQLTQELLQLGQSVVLEFGFWGRAERDEKRLEGQALGASVELRYLAVPLAVLRQRLKARNKQAAWGAVTISRAQLEHWATMLQAPDKAELQLFDSYIVTRK